MKRFLNSIICLALVFTGLTGQITEKRQYRATKVKTAPAIDGVLNDEAWKEGDWADEFTQNRPYNGKPSIQRTDFKILFDDDNLYVAIRSFDSSPDSIINRLTRRDQADGDLAGIIIDSFHDLRTGFLFGVSSSGVKYDQMFTNDGQNQDPSWDPNWWVKTSVNKEGWIAEMRIPFSQLRFDKNSGDVWGFDVARIIYRYDEQSFWQPIPRDASEFIHLMGELTGLERIKPRKILDVTPYGVVKAETFKAEPGNPFREKGRKFGFNGGLDAKIGITNNMTMDLTINPDFGQVEADPSVVNLTAYETFFNEKRPFFIEGNNITDFNIGLGNGNVGNDNLFYSRRIGRAPHGDPDLGDGEYADVPITTRIIGAGKLTGKTKNGLSVGFIDAVTAEEKAKIEAEGERKHETVEPLTNYFIGRVQKDFNEGKTIIGGILTGTNRNLDPNLADFIHKSAYSGGFDFTQYTRDKKWMFNLNAAFSQVNGSRKALDYTQRSSARYFQRPDNDYTKYDTTRTSLMGSGGRMQIQRLKGHLFLLGAVTWKSPGFETNDLGYLREADQFISVVVAGYSLWDPKWIYRNFNINGDIYVMNNFGGDITSTGFEWNSSAELKNYWNVWTGGSLNGPSLSTGMLRGGPIMKVPGNTSVRVGFSSDYHKKFTYSIYFNGSNGWEKDSWNLNTGTDISFKPTNYLSLTLSPSYSKSFSELQYVDNLTYNGNERYIFGSIKRKTISSSLRVNLNLNPNLTIQYWGQPFIASGNYYDSKYISDPLADSYRNRFHTYTSDQVSEESDHYSIDENIDGNEDYTIDKMDFNFKAFLSNLVLRWEYSPGSSVYFVWSQTRNGYNPTGRLDFFSDFGDLFNHKLYIEDDNYRLNNVFLIKFSYRFGLK